MRHPGGADVTHDVLLWSQLSFEGTRERQIKSILLDLSVKISTAHLKKATFC